MDNGHHGNNETIGGVGVTHLYTNATNHTIDINNNTKNINDTTNCYCYDFLYRGHGYLNIRTWDVITIFPNILLLLFITQVYPRIKRTLATATSTTSLASNSTSIVVATFLEPIYLLLVVHLIRFFALYTAIEIFASQHFKAIEHADRSVWLLIRFATFSLEIFILLHGFLANPEIRSSIAKIATMSVVISCICSLIQISLGTGEGTPGYIQAIIDSDVNLMSPAADFFWACVTTIMSLVYFLVGSVPRTFYHSASVDNFSPVYVWTMSMMNFAQAIAHVMLWHKQLSGLCLVQATNYAYFGLYLPFVYYFYVKGQMTTGPTSLLFSYKESNLNELNDGDIGDSSAETSASTTDQRRLTISAAPLVNTKSMNSEFIMHNSGPLFSKNYLDSGTAPSNSIVIDDITKTHA